MIWHHYDIIIYFLYAGGVRGAASPPGAANVSYLCLHKYPLRTKIEPFLNYTGILGPEISNRFNTKCIKPTLSS